MSFIRGLLFIVLLSFVSLCSSFEQLRCKAVPGCKIARCDPTPFSLIHLQRNEFPISCVSDDVGNKNTKDDEIKKLEDKIENLASDVKRLWDMNEFQNADMRRMRKQLDDSTKENKKLQSELTATQKTVAELEDKNERLENDLAATQKTVTEFKEKNERLENDLVSTQKTVTELKKNNQRLENDLVATQKTITELQEQNKDFENKIKALDKKNSKISTTLTPTTSTVAVDSLTRNDEKTTDCYGGFRYNEICYWTVVHDTLDIDFAKAENICRLRNGVPAYPLNEEHYNIMIRLIEKGTSGRVCPSKFVSLCYLWTGLIYDFTPLHDMSLPEGSPAPYRKMWYQHGGISNSGVGMAVGKDSTGNTRDGMGNIDPTDKLMGVFCQKANIVPQP